MQAYTYVEKGKFALLEKLKPVLFPLLAEVLRADGQTIDGIYERNDEALRAKEGLEQNKGWFTLPGESHPKTTQTEICENGVYYHVDFENGQKTGFFLDQKYNRRAVARLAAGHTVLDCFTHTGSFALHAAHFGAKEVIGVDISDYACEFAAENADRCALFFDGEILACDTPTRFFSENNFYTTAANRIVNEVKNINRVMFDYTTKPPATIEFE